MPGFEQLESRLLMAVTADLSAGTLTITGDDARNVITIEADTDPAGAGNITVGVRGGFDPDGAGPEGEVEEFDFTGVNTIVINAAGGNDKIKVRQGVTLGGGEGATIQVNSGEGNDMVTVGQGLTSGGATIGVTVNDTGGRNRIFTGEGNDAITTGAGKDIIRSGDGNDTINSGGGNDNVRAGAGDDEIDGDAGKDNIRGNAGDDSIEGGTGNDNIRGGPGNDTLSGGAGKDNFGPPDPDDTTPISDVEEQTFRERNRPNNTGAQANANPLALGYDTNLALTGAVRADDGDATTNEDNVDFFRVDINDPGLLTITLEGLNGRHAQVVLLDNTGSVVPGGTLAVTPEDRTEQVELSIGGSNPTGAYYVRLTTTATGRPSKYRVTLDLEEEEPLII